MFCLQSTFCISQAGIFFFSLGLSFLNYSSRDLRQLLDSLEHWRGRVSGPQGAQLLGTGILYLPECLPYSFDVRVPRRTNEGVRVPVGRGIKSHQGSPTDGMLTGQLRYAKM